MNVRDLVVPAAALCAAIACGGSQPAEVPTVSQAPPSDVAREEVPELTPVAAPESLVAMARIAAPDRMIDTVAGWSGLPFDWRVLLSNEAPGLDAVLRLDVPVDLGVVLDPAATLRPRILVAVSAGVTSVDAAVAYLEKRGMPAERMGAGVYLVQVEDKAICALAPALGVASGRLVCGAGREAVDVLLPYLTRGAPTASLPDADLHLRVLGEPLRRRFGGQLALLKTAGVRFLMNEVGLDSPNFDRAARDVLYGIADELLAVLDDMDRATLDLTIRPDAQGADLALGLVLRGQQSWTSRMLVSGAERMAAPPEIFWRLPGDADAASFGRSGDLGLTEGVGRAVTALADGLLEHYGVGPKVRRDLVRALEGFWALEGAWAQAQGVLDPPSAYASLTPAERLRETARAGAGYRIVGIEGDRGRVQALIAALVQVYNDPQLRTSVAKRSSLRAGEWPRAVRRALRGPAALRGGTVFEVVVPGSMFASARTRAADGPAPKLDPLSLQLVLVPDGEVTWLGIAADEGLLYEKLAAAKTGTDEVRSLAGHPGLADLKERRVWAAGFTSLRAAVAGFEPSLDELAAAVLGGSADASPFRHRRALSVMPSRGRTPVQWDAVASREGPAATLSFHVPRAVLQDIAAGAAIAAAAR